jgi:hypothetical protein
VKHHLKGNALPATVLKERHGRVTYAYDNEPKRLHTSYRAAFESAFEPCCIHNEGNCCETLAHAGLCEPHRARQAQALQEQVVLLRAYLQQQENWLVSVTLPLPS